MVIKLAILPSRASCHLNGFQFFLTVSMCICLLYVHCMCAGTQGAQKRAMDPLELKLWPSCPSWERDLGSPQKQCLLSSGW